MGRFIKHRSLNQHRSGLFAQDQTVIGACSHLVQHLIIKNTYGAYFPDLIAWSWDSWPRQCVHLCVYVLDYTCLIDILVITMETLVDRHGNFDFVLDIHIVHLSWLVERYYKIAQGTLLDGPVLFILFTCLHFCNTLILNQSSPDR